MKKSLLYFSFLSFASVGFAQTQIGNGSFESWEPTTDEINEPVNWNSFKSASGGLSGFGGQQMDRRVNARPGSSGTQSARIWSRDAGFGVKANGNMTLGRINMGSTTPSNSNNHNYSSTSTTGFSEAFTDTPDSIVAWVKYKPGNTSSGYNARISTVIHNNTDGYKDPNDVAGGNTVATAILNFPYTNGGWQRISVPFTYVGSPSNGAFILVTFTTNNVPGGGTTSDTLYVDDVELVYVPVPSYTSTSTTVCVGNTVTFTNTSTHYATSYSWSFPGGTPSTSTDANPVVTYATPGTYDVVLTATNQWGSKTITSTNYVTVNGIDDASFSYPTSTLCVTGGNSTPTATTAGTYSASPSGLNFVSSATGEINTAGSTVGTYTITHTTGGACPNTSTTTITVTSIPDAAFNYSATSYCSSLADQNPTFGGGASAGAFTSFPAGLTVNATTGSVQLTSSNAGTYYVVNTIAASGGCPAAADTVQIEVIAAPVVSLDLVDTVCTSSASFTLSGGLPAGGLYSGSAVIAGNFDPSTVTPNTTSQVDYLYSDGTCSNSVSVTIFVSACLDQVENEIDGISIYPNPSTGIVNISDLSTDTQVVLYSVDGTQILSTNTSTSNSTIDLSSIAKGTYFLRVASVQGTKTVQLILN